MLELTGDLIKCYKGESNVYAPLSGCFEHYGFDFMIGMKFRVAKRRAGNSIVIIVTRLR